MKHLPAWAALAALACGAGAQGLPDPTRPPDADSAAFAVEGGGNPGSGLQSVILSPRGKPLAIVDGQQVTVGSKIGDARVVRIDESAVVLRSPDGEQQVLRMTPGVEKQPSEPAPKRMRATTRRASPAPQQQDQNQEKNPL